VIYSALVEANQAKPRLVLSLFPGVGLFDRGFEDVGFCVVRGPDTLWGGDIHNFHAPAGHFTGVIGGPPCQDFSTINRKRDSARGMELVGEFLRVVAEADPEWWLMENVPGSPTVTAPASIFYCIQPIMLDASHVGSQQHRLRKFHFGCKPGGKHLVIAREVAASVERTCLATEGRRHGRRTWAHFCNLQGLPDNFDLPGFKVAEKYRAVGNGVPYALSRALAQAVLDRDHAVTPHRTCECGCGLYVHGAAKTATAACRKRIERERNAQQDARAVFAEANTMRLF